MCMMDAFFWLISIYPRKGTETKNAVSASSDAIHFNLSPQKPSQALRASSPEGRAFAAAVYPDVKLPLRGSWHGVSRD